MRFYADLTLVEIADALRAPLSTVKVRLYRGLRLLKVPLCTRHTESEASSPPRVTSKPGAHAAERALILT
jgi:Sigma-70, region 4